MHHELKSMFIRFIYAYGGNWIGQNLNPTRLSICISKMFGFLIENFEL